MVESMTAEEIWAWVTLASAKGMTAGAALRMMKSIGLPEEVLRADLTTLSRLVGMPLAQAVRAAGAGANDAEVERAVSWLNEQPQTQLLPIAAPNYPMMLIQSGFAPLVLWLRGNAELLQRRIISAAGTEQPSDKAQENARGFGEALAYQGAAVAAMLTSGVEAAALEGALRAGGALAVLAVGPDRVYPASALNLQRKILAEGGLLLSAYPPGDGIPASGSEREARLNEVSALCAALSEGVLVIAAERCSPAVRRARLAADFGREVWAVPGDIHSSESGGPHQLIREGAKLAESAADIFS